MTETYVYEPSKGHGLPHGALKAHLAPRPIGWISTRDGRGRVHFALDSFLDAFGAEPPVIDFSSRCREDGLRNVEEAASPARPLIAAGSLPERSGGTTMEDALGGG